MKTYSWDERIARANRLAKSQAQTRQILDVYLKVAAFQKKVGDSLMGAEHANIDSLLRFVPDLEALVRELGSEPLQQTVAALGNDPERWLELLMRYWEQDDQPESPADAFLAYVLIQPYAQHVTSRMTIAQDQTMMACPACGNLPQVSLLREFNNGAKRSLVCSVCATEWETRRVWCVNCGIEDKDKLPVFTAGELPQARIEACDNCKTYTKCLDLTQDGNIVPQVDDLATVALDLWAQEQGYERRQASVFLLPAEEEDLEIG